MLEEVLVDCAACGEAMALDVDTTGGEEQSYFEDCPVCCRPLIIRAHFDEASNDYVVDVRRE